MKRKLFSLLITICLLLIPFKVFASSASISVSGSSSVVVGSNVTITVKLSSSTAIGSWEYLINYDSSMLKLVEGKTKVVDYTQEAGGIKSKTYTLKFKALKSGNAKVSVGSYEVYAYNDESLMSVSAGSKTVKIITQEQLEASYSKNNNLSNITVEGYEISPEFKSDILEYKVDLPSNVESIEVGAKLADSKAKVSGTGTISVTEGENKIELVVTAENGSTKTYTLVANVVDQNPINVEVDGKNYTVVKRLSSLDKPELFADTTIKIGDGEIPAFYSDATKITLVGLKDSEGNISLFIYKDGEYFEYRELKFSNITLLLMDNNEQLDYYKKSTVSIGDKEYDCMKVSDSSEFVLFYGMNMVTGKEEYYVYDSIDQTLQRYDDEIIVKLTANLQEKESELKTLYIVLAVLIVFMIFVIVMFSVKNHKIKKALNITGEKNKKGSKESKE